MTEKIGNVVLDYTYYPEEDFYSDGDVEDRLLSYVQEYEPSQYDEVIAQTKDWAVMYHLSHIRQNILAGTEISKEDSVLEIGAGCGAVTGTLAERAKDVTCIELSKRRSLINAWHNKDYDNIRILVGNFQDIEPHLEQQFDVITLIGVLEYASLYIDSDNPYEEFLRTISSHLKPDGRLVIAIENKFGLKYWAGCREDHLSSYFSGLEGYDVAKDGVCTFSKQELEQLSEAAGFAEQEFYYPYPDYKFPTAIYSDERLPKQGELDSNLRNFDHERVVLFDETKVYDEIIKSDLFPFFSNSYLVILRKNKGIQNQAGETKQHFWQYPDDKEFLDKLYGEMGRGAKSLQQLLTEASSSEQDKQKLDEVTAENENTRQRLTEVTAEYEAMQQSRSWKITKPLRKVTRIFK